MASTDTTNGTSEEMQAEEEACTAVGELALEEKDMAGDENDDSDLNDEEDADDPPGDQEEDQAWREERRSMPKQEIWFMPTLQVYREELKKFQNACTVLIGPANLMDLSEPLIFQHIQLSCKFRVHFQKKGEEQLEATESFAGFIELLFPSEDLAKACAEDLKDFRPGLIVRQTIQTDNKAPDHSDIQGCVTATKRRENERHTLSVRGIVPSVTKEDLEAFFPKALDVMIPWSYASNTRKWHAYVEFATKDEVEEYAGKPVLIKGHYYKTFILRSIPTVNQLISSIERERNAAPQMGAMSGEKRAHILMMYRQARHYLDSDEFELDPDKKKQLHAGKHLLRNKINTDNKKRKRQAKYEEEKKEANKQQRKRPNVSTPGTAAGKRVRPLLPTPGRGGEWAQPVGNLRGRGRGRNVWGSNNSNYNNYQQQGGNYQTGFAEGFDFRGSNYNEDSYGGGNYGNSVLGGPNINPQKAVELIVGLGNMLQNSASMQGGMGGNMGGRMGGSAGGMGGGMMGSMGGGMSGSMGGNMGGSMGGGMSLNRGPTPLIPPKNRQFRGGRGGRW